MDAVEQKILAAVDAQRETLLAFAQDIGAHAEPGFFETRPPPAWPNCCAAAGFRRNALARTRVKAVLQGGAPGPCAVIGELDGILCPADPAANPENGVARGHNAQLTALVGAALGRPRAGWPRRFRAAWRFLPFPPRNPTPPARGRRCKSRAWNSAAANPNCCARAASTAWTLRMYI